MPKKPAYMTVYDTVKKWIYDEKYKTGDLLPPEPMLCGIFGVSRTTIRKAIEILARDGFISVQQGIGTVVLDYKVMQNLNKITSFTDTLKRKGFDVSVKSMHIDKINAYGNIASMLGLDDGTPVAQVQRITNASGTPIAIMKNYIPYDRVEGIENNNNRFISLYQFLREQYGIVMEMAKDRISSKNANFEQSQLLGLNTGAALLCINRLCISKGKPVCYDVLHIRSDMYEFEVSLYGDD